MLWEGKDAGIGRLPGDACEGGGGLGLDGYGDRTVEIGWWRFDSLMMMLYLLFVLALEAAFIRARIRHLEFN